MYQPDLAELERAAALAYQAMPATPQYSSQRGERHRLAEGAGAAALAAAMQIKDSPGFKGRKIGLPLSGGNVDAELLRHILQGP